MGIIGFHVKSRAQESNTAADMAGGVIDQTLGNRPRIVPQYLSRFRVEGICVIGSRDVHDPIDNHRSNFKNAGISAVEDPLSLKMSDILRRDLRKAAKTPSCVITVVRGPVVLNRSRLQLGGVSASSTCEG